MRIRCYAKQRVTGLRSTARIGCHAIDQCRFLVGEVKNVMARVGVFNAARAVPSAGCKDIVVDEATFAILESGDFFEAYRLVYSAGFSAQGGLLHNGWWVDSGQQLFPIVSTGLKRFTIFWLERGGRPELQR